MKKNLLSFALTLTLGLGVFQTCQAAVATKVEFWTFWVSLPDANRATNSFPVTRDNLMAGLKLGGVFDTRGRESSPTGLDFQRHFDAGDVTTTTGNQELWRGQFNPLTPFTNNFGNRGYCPVIVQGIDGQVSVSRLSWRVYGGILSGGRDLAAETYSITRVGINAGPDGKLWTADDIYIQTGDGTQLVDAIVYIGASLSSPNADSVGDMTDINNHLTSGLPITVEYKFIGATGHVFHSNTIKVYPLGGIPDSGYGLWPIKTPYGLLWSLAGPTGSKWEVGKSSVVNGSYTPTETANAGFSIPAFFEQNPRMFYRIHRVQ